MKLQEDVSFTAEELF